MPLKLTQIAMNGAEGTFSSGNGSGLPAGGASGTVLVKLSGLDGDAGWTALTKTLVGLGNVDNTSDANKPISTATQTALNGKVSTVSTAGQVYATDSGGAQTTIAYATSATASTLVRRDANGRFSAAAPVNDSDVVNLGTMNTALGTKADASVVAGKVNSSTTASIVYGTDGTGLPALLSYSVTATGNTVPYRSSTGTIATATATDNAHAVPLSQMNTALAAKEGTVAAGTTAQYYRGDKSWQTLNKSAVGLGNVDNTSDVDKPVSTATQTALNAKLDKNTTATNSVYVTGATAGTQTVRGIDTAPVSASTNLITSGAVYTAVQDAIGGVTPDVSGKLDKDIASTNSVYATGSTAGTQTMRSIVTTVTSGSTALITSGAVYTGLSGKENTVTTGTTAQYYRGDKSWQTLNKAAVGLANVDNTSDVNKPISTATQTALDAKAAATDLSGKLDKDTAATNSVYAKGSATGTQEMRSIVTTVTSGSTALVTSGAVYTGLSGKENTVTAGTTAQYYRGDKSWQTLNKAAVGLGNVDNTSDVNKPISTATQTALDAKAAATDLSGKLDKNTTDTNSVYVTGATSGTQTMRSIVTTVTSGSTALITSGAVYTGLSGKENTVTTGTTAQYYRGDKSWQALNKAAVGLGNVDNTSDADKPISTATQTALDAKAAATDLSGKLDKNTTSTNAVYAKGSATGTQEMRSIVTTVTSGSTSLVTSGAVYTAVDARLSKDTTATNSVYAKGSAAGTQEMRAITAVVTSGSNALVTSGGVDTKFADYLPARLRATEAAATSGSLLEADTLYFYPDP
jgi:quercetin dioxygenase-like cupin family protein